jgi:hypothetical protein
MNEYTMGVLRDLSISGAYLLVNADYGDCVVIPGSRGRVVPQEVTSVLFSDGLVKSGPYTPGDQQAFITDAGAEIISQHRVEDALIDQQHAEIDAAPETIGYQIVSEAKYDSFDTLNLPAYRYTVTLVVKWTDEYTRRPLAEQFYGYGPDWETAQAQADEQRAAWIVRMNAIGSRKFGKAVL